MKVPAEPLIILPPDFITKYSKEFGIADNNLHGNNEFSFSEIALRRISAQEAIKTLILDGLVIVYQSENGFKYSIPPKGITFCKTLTSVYAQEYRTFAEKRIPLWNQKLKRNF